MQQVHPLWSPVTRRSGLPEDARLRLFALRGTPEQREAIAPPLDALIEAIAQALAEFTSKECANCLANSGYRRPS
ncbi:MAG: hypothetical protein ACT4O2_04880 [Beijerinckiaceae bacterium]